MLAKEQAFAELASDLQWTAATATGEMLPQFDAAGEFPEENANDDFYAAFDLALETELTLGL